MSAPGPVRPSPSETNWETWPGRSRLRVVLFIFAVALAFQGSRGLWEPDEGRYAHAALEMLRSGDWLVPRLHGLAYLDKPPMVYWATAAGLALLGPNAWGARLAGGLAFALTACLVLAWAAREWPADMARRAGAAYAVTLLPAIGGNTLTPDTLLALWTTATAFAWWRYRTTLFETAARGLAARRWGWALLAGLCLGLGLATKGPAALIFAAPIGLFVLLQRELVRFLRRPEAWIACVLALGLGGAWNWVLGSSLPGAAAYFFDNQVSGRLWESSYQRNSKWWQAITVYGPTLLVGALPWTVFWPRLARKEGRARFRAALADPFVRFLSLAVAVPIVVLVLAHSRLPLYLLPMMPAAVLLTIRLIPAERAGATWRAILVTAALLLVLKGAGGLVPSHRDSSQLGARLVAQGVAPSDCLDIVSTKAHGLSLEGFERTTWHSLGPEPYPYFERPRVLADDVPELLTQCQGRLWVLSESQRRDATVEHLNGAGLACDRRTLDDRSDLYLCRPRAAAEPPAPRPPG